MQCKAHYNLGRLGDFGAMGNCTTSRLGAGLKELFTLIPSSRVAQVIMLMARDAAGCREVTMRLDLEIRRERKAQ